ncbi:MAG: sugar ABC transporter permease [Anaerolineae bacterium]|nr:sugar ABC transporter permease [Anaerolineae bacterium]
MNTPFLNFLGKTPLSRRRALWGILLILPNTFGLFFFFGYPILRAFATSFYEWNAFKPARYVGLENFERLIDDPMFRQALENTAQLLLLIVPAEVIIALGLAMLLNQKLKGRIVFRTLYFLPVVTSTIAASIVWTWIFQPRYGLVGLFLEPFGWRDTAWLTRPNLVLYPIAFVTIWQRIGFDIVLFLAGLQAVPRVLLEAATIDGANRWQRFRKVTLPMLSPTTFLVVVLSIINNFQIFDQVYIMTARTIRGGVGGSARTLSLYLYESGFLDSEYGYASTIALILFVIILGITAVQLSAQRYWVYYESEEG